MAGIRAFVVVLSLAVASCATGPPTPCRTGEHSAVGDALYFGMARPGGVVTPEEWQQFVAGEVTPRFPAGFTQWQASGQWISKDGELEREPSRVVYVVHPDDRHSEDAIHDIIERYRRQFQQEAVLRVRTTVCASL